MSETPAAGTAGAARPFTTSDFDYALPPELIAQEPVTERGQSRLLVVHRRAAGGLQLRDAQFPQIRTLMTPGDLLVVNTTKVRHARFLGLRPSGQPAEVLLIQPAADDTWIAMGKPGSALKPGKRITIADGVEIETVEELASGHRRVRFLGMDAPEAIARHGRLPLPPYIDRDPTAMDEERYQTVYAEREGSVAAPTAGLHFTTDLMAKLHQAGIVLGRLDLEVGPGTFKPVDGEDITAHTMHSEKFEVPETLAEQIRALRARGGKLWAVGTTVVRALESVAREDGTVEAGRGATSLMIAPGYRYRAVDRLITNFHLPRSTLLMLVAAFIGYDETMAVYRHAVAQRYRFYSYGDAMALIPGG